MRTLDTGPPGNTASEAPQAKGRALWTWRF